MLTAIESRNFSSTPPIVRIAIGDMENGLDGETIKNLEKLGEEIKEAKTINGVPQIQSKETWMVIVAEIAPGLDEETMVGVACQLFARICECFMEAIADRVPEIH